jgi:hypothetical protein
MLIFDHYDREISVRLIVDGIGSVGREYVRSMDNLHKLGSLIRYPLRGVEDLLRSMSAMERDFDGFKSQKRMGGDVCRCETMQVYSRAAQILAEKLRSEIPIYISQVEKDVLRTCMNDASRHKKSYGFTKVIEDLGKVMYTGNYALSLQNNLKNHLRLRRSTVF